jgi:glutamyl-tRNA synthetase
LGYRQPQYAHLPFVAEPGSKTKLSKRKLDKYLKNKDFANLVEHGRKIAERIGHPTEADAFNPVIVDFYETVGYLPEAIVNYLSLLGWSMDDKTEHFSIQELIDNFSLERVGKSAASFDCQKLWAFEDRHFQLLPLQKKLDLMTPFLEKAGFADAPKERIQAVILAAGDRIKVSGDILSFDEFFLREDAFSYDEKAVEKHLKKDDALALLVKFRDRLAATDPFDVPTLEKLMHDFTASENIKVNQIIHALRVAVTGKTIGLGLFDTLAILGKTASLARIERTLDWVKS